MFWCFGHKAYGIFTPRSGIVPAPPAFVRWPGKSRDAPFLNRHLKPPDRFPYLGARSVLCNKIPRCFWHIELGSTTLVKEVVVSFNLMVTNLYWLTSVPFVQSVVSDSLRPSGLQHTRLPCPSPSPGAWSNLCPLSWWCHPNILSSVAPFSSCLRSFPASQCFPISWLFASGGQSTRASTSSSVLPMNI